MVINATFPQQSSPKQGCFKAEVVVFSSRGADSFTGIDDVAGEDVVVELVAELPPRQQLHVDLVSSLHLQQDHLEQQTFNRHARSGREQNAKG